MTPRNTIFDFATPETLDAGDPQLDRARRQVQLGSERLGDRASASTRPPPTPARTSAACGARPAHCSPPPPSPTKPASGWQQVTFSEPVPITAGTTYVAGYLAPNGHYSATSAAFSSAGLSNPPLQALANGISPNGVYEYSHESHVPHQQLQRHELLGRCAVRAGLVSTSSGAERPRPAAARTQVHTTHRAPSPKLQRLRAACQRPCPCRNRRAARRSRCTAAERVRRLFDQ